MLDLLARNWWLFVVRGAAAIIFGILAFVWPSLTLAVLVLLVAAYFLVDGLSLLVSLALGDPVARRNAWTVALMGVLGVVVGVAAFVWPGVTALSLLYLVAFWSIVLGVIQVITAIQMRREIQGELWMALGGAIADHLRPLPRDPARRRPALAGLARRHLGRAVRHLLPDVRPWPARAPSHPDSPAGVIAGGCTVAP